MKRYALFAGEDYYPSGGWCDFVDAYDSSAEAFAAGRKLEGRGKWSQVIDLHIGKEIDEQEAKVTAE